MLGNYDFHLKILTCAVKAVQVSTRAMDQIVVVYLIPLSSLDSDLQLFFVWLVGLVGWFVCFSFFLFCFIVQIDCIRITCMDLSNEKQAQLPAKIHCQFRHLLNLPRLDKVLNTHLCSNFKENEWQLSTFKNLLVCFVSKRSCIFMTTSLKSHFEYILRHLFLLDHPLFSSRSMHVMITVLFNPCCV